MNCVPVWSDEPIAKCVSELQNHARSSTNGTASVHFICRLEREDLDKRLHSVFLSHYKPQIVLEKFSLSIQDAVELTTLSWKSQHPFSESDLGKLRISMR